MTREEALDYFVGRNEVGERPYRNADFEMTGEVSCCTRRTSLAFFNAIVLDDFVVMYRFW